jgi:hypothetical protein
MPALVAGIHVFCGLNEDVDGRNQSGHDASPTPLSPPKSDLSDFGQLKVPNSGKPEGAALVCSVKEWVRGFGSNYYRR